MAKLMLSTFVFISVSAAAQSDVTLRSYNEEDPFTFSIKVPSSTLLAYWTTDRNATFSIEFEGLGFWRNGHYVLLDPLLYPKGSKAWHFVGINMRNTELKIHPYDKSYGFSYSNGPITITIKSNRRIYWQRCRDFFSCDLPGPESTATEDLKTLLLLGTSCLLAVMSVIVVGLVVCIIRLKKSTLNVSEARANTRQENFYDEIQLRRHSGNSPRAGVAHETVNSIYGTVIPSEKRP